MPIVIKKITKEKVNKPLGQVGMAFDSFKILISEPFIKII
jgi:hypothetical protein